MPVVKRLAVADLQLDPKNFRHMPQRTEERALHAMAALDTAYFWGLARGLLEKGYVEVENIVVLKSTATDQNPSVQEGNRRIGILKLALGNLKGKDLEIPEEIRDLLSKLTPEWRRKNSEVPCLIFEPTEKSDAENVVDLTHGKGELAGRLDWNAVARARHNKIRNDANEPALDFLEKYIQTATNLSVDEKERWAATYPLSILLNAINLTHPRMGFKSTRELVDAYPKITKYKGALDNIIHGIGRGQIITDAVREANFAVNYGIPPAQPTPTTKPTGGGSTSALGVSAPSIPTPKKVKAVASNTQVAVRRLLRKLQLHGANRNKIVVLKDELLHLNLENNPHAFCFVLRTMFELSAKAYCEDHKTNGGPMATQGNADRQLVEVIKDIYKHMENAKAAISQNGKPDKQWVKQLHGAMTELTAPNSLFSITSMNQLVHGSTFSVTEKHICTVFSNVFQMLQEMNY